MKCNVGSTDRVIRILIGIALIVLGIVYLEAGTWPIVGIVLGAVLFLTGILGRCGLYVPFKINTCRSRDEQTSGGAQA